MGMGICQQEITPSVSVSRVPQRARGREESNESKKPKGKEMERGRRGASGLFLSTTQDL